MRNRYDCLIFGAGTVGYWVVKELSGSFFRDRIERLVIVDRSRVKTKSAITCPEYGRNSAHGRFKSSALAELARDWFERPDLEIEGVNGCIEEFPWDRFVRKRNRSFREPETDLGGPETFLFVGLDDWSSRVVACGDVRRAASRLAEDSDPHRPLIPALQIGLDRNEASVFIFGSDCTDPCPACGLPFLPETEPCVVFDERGRLLRGNLRREARAAARTAVEGAQRLAVGDRSLLNTKTSLFLDPESERFRIVRRLCVRRERCWGPHDEAAPVSWEGKLERFHFPRGGEHDQ